MLFRPANPYDHERLTDKNIQNYILSSNLNYSDISLKSVNKLAIQPFLQNDLRKNSENCSITSIATCVNYYCSRTCDINEIYAVTETIANNYFYDPAKFGTMPFFIKTIYDQDLKYFQKPKVIKSKYIKHLGFSFKTIKQQIDNKHPVILSLYTDNRNFYRSHTVVIIGYAQFNLFNSETTLFEKKKVKNMLLVYDNWSKEISYIDPDVLSPISSIVF